MQFEKWDNGSALAYRLWARTAARRSLLNASQFAVGGTQIRDGLLYVAANESLTISEVGEDGLTILSSLDLGTARDVIVEGSYAFVAAGDRGLVVVDVSDPANPMIVSETAAVGYIRKLVQDRKSVFATAGQFGVMEFDISDPLAPTWSDVLYVDNVVDDVDPAPGSLVVTTLTGEIELFGLRGKNRFKKLSSIIAKDWVQATKVRGSHLFVLNANGLVEEYDIGAAARPKKVGEPDTAGLAMTEQTDEALQAAFGGTSWFSNSVELYGFVDDDDGE
ncbi:MAG: hypothetical protein WC931_03685 [Bacilli bacterium]